MKKKKVILLLTILGMYVCNGYSQNTDCFNEAKRRGYVVGTSEFMAAIKQCILDNVRGLQNQLSQKRSQIRTQESVYSNKKAEEQRLRDNYFSYPAREDSAEKQRAYQQYTKAMDDTERELARLRQLQAEEAELQRQLNALQNQLK